MPARRIVTLAALAALAACERRPPAARQGGAASESAPGGTRTSAAPTPGTPEGGTPSPCRPEELAVRRVGGDAGAGHRALRIALVSAASAPCTLSGRPGVAVLDSAGRRVAAVRVEPFAGNYLTGNRPAGPVTLAPGAAAVFDVHWGVVEGEPAGCPEGAALAIAPPGAPVSDAIGRVEVPVRACGARIEVTSLVSAADTVAP
ncbi:MAG TPA: DUF4232 domain-containing protein [Gemmatimonadaceae bacterium]|nr:DUF4232 domain-containing protein [Gemmatimonadaceae bacterium]